MAVLRIGKVRPSPKGVYDPLLPYEAFDLVNWKGSSYLSLQAVPIGQEPDISPTYWTLYAEKGTDGKDGATGPQGPQGEQGPQGIQGPQGDIGPRPGHQWSGTQLRFQNVDGTWGQYVDLEGPVGPEGPQGIQGPVGPEGPRGPQGAQGPQGPKGDTGPRPAHEWDGTSVRFQNADGTWGEYSDLQGPVGPTGPQGIQGPVGPRPAHEWSGNSLRFQQSDGSWGTYVDLTGPQGPQGPKGDQGDPPAAADLLSTLKTVDGTGSGLDADLLDGLQASAFLRSNANSVTTGELGARHGLHGDYAGGASSGENWGATIWGLGTAYTGTASGTAYAPTSLYGVSWLRAAHPNADAQVGEGLYLYQNGVFKGAIGSLGIKTSGNIRTTAGVIAQGDLTAFSDIRVKTNIEPITKALQKLQQLYGVTYDRTDIKTQRQAGLIAQDVQKVLPEAVREEVIDGHGDTRLTLNYNAVIGLLVEGIKELTSQIAELTKRLEQLEESNGTAG